MTTAAPERSLDQRMTALRKANEVRTYRAALKRDLKAGRADVRDLLLVEDLDERLETAKIIDVLLATPKVGRVKAVKMLNRARISPSKTLAGMTQRQRSELAVELGIRPGA